MATSGFGVRDMLTGVKSVIGTDIPFVLILRCSAGKTRRDVSRHVTLRFHFGPLTRTGRSIATISSLAEVKHQFQR